MLKNGKSLPLGCRQSDLEAPWRKLQEYVAGGKPPIATGDGRSDSSYAGRRLTDLAFWHVDGDPETWMGSRKVPDAPSLTLNRQPLAWQAQN
jgi:hypothetical protein